MGNNKNYKTCSGCLCSKHISLFHKKAQTPDGYAYQCKDCTNAYARKAKAVRESLTQIKTCYTCQKQLHITHFHRSNQNNDGRAGSCKSCKMKENSNYRKSLKEKAKVMIEDSSDYRSPAKSGFVTELETAKKMLGNISTSYDALEIKALYPGPTDDCTITFKIPLRDDKGEYLDVSTHLKNLKHIELKILKITER